VVYNNSQGAAMDRINHRYYIVFIDVYDEKMAVEKDDGKQRRGVIG
jgi:hypothetical protein